MQNGLSRDADFIDYRARVCTSADQLPLTSGDVEREWVENGRHCIAYRMDSKTADIYPFVSARCTVRRDTWHGPSGDVAVEIDYQRGHEYNVDRMVAGVKDSLATYSAHCGAYQHRILRIVEFPRMQRNGGFAASYPNTVPFSEALGFTARVDDSDPSDIDYPYVITAHEVAHQWWAHQEMPANVEGGEFITESLAEYSALMVLKHKYGDVKMRRFLKYELDRYLLGRGMEQKTEPTLMRATGAAYVHYQKGALALYAEGRARALRVAGRDRRAGHQPGARGVPEALAFRRPAVRAFGRPALRVQARDASCRQREGVEQPDGSSQGDLVVTARQIRSDGAGNESDVPFDGPVDIGVLDANGNVLRIEKHPVRSGENRFTLHTTGDPAKAGIDPLGKLIDRDASDHVVAVTKRGAPRDVRPRLRCPAMT